MAKRRNKNKTYPVMIVGERVTPERRKQLGGIVTEVVEVEDAGRRKAKVSRARAKYVSTIAYYHGTQRLDDEQTMAAEKYAEIYNRVSFGYHYKVLSSPFLFEPGHADPEARVLAHMYCIRQLHEVDNLLSPSQRRLIVNVCGFDQCARTTAEIKILQRALDVAARHWGYKPPKPKANK